MPTYQIQLYETRMTEVDTDDVALFDVTCDENEQMWRVPVFLSPLFRILHMGALPEIKSRQDMVAGLGARAIAERLRQGLEPPFEQALVFTSKYPGAPDAPNPLSPYKRVIVRGSEIKSVPD